MSTPSWSVYSAIQTNDGFRVVRTKWTETGPDLPGQTTVANMPGATEDEALQRVRALQRGYDSARNTARDQT